MTNLATQRQVSYIMMVVKHSDIELPEKSGEINGKPCNTTDHEFSLWLHSLPRTTLSEWIRELDTDDDEKREMVLEQFEQFINENYA
jgi:hypothetical protein